MIKRNGDNVFAIASSNNQCQGARSAVSLYPGPGGAATRIPRATAARMTPPDAQHHSKEANIALSTYVEKWKNRYEESERKHKAYLLKSEKGQSLFIFVEKNCFVLLLRLYLRMLQKPLVVVCKWNRGWKSYSRICRIMTDVTCCLHINNSGNSYLNT